MIASLPMYARPELRASHDRYWSLIRHELASANIDGPAELSQDGDEQRAWNDPSLVLSQTCGMPYRNSLHGAVTLIGTPDYKLDGCNAGYYRSALVVRRTDSRTTLPDFEHAVFAYNETFSQSGYAAPFQHLATFGFWFDSRIHTGQHLASAKAVAAGKADIASLDAMSWKLMQRYDDFATQLRVLEWTVPTPGLPYISAAGADQQAIFDAVNRAIAALEDSDREQLGIFGLIAIPSSVYLAMPNPTD